MYQQWVVKQNATGNLFQVTTYDSSDNSKNSIYRIMGKYFGMTGTNAPDFDTGNVDIEIVAIEERYTSEIPVPLFTKS